ncbi:putative HTH-type transcriptional regulator [Paraburkholderia domus]|jgi:DNA-binding transcriptional MerR regulator|uniref:HTH-type transcriptional regulator n=1 Tax=Paraburkholderia domus TaxID=2793075 RepID=A0A9N8MY01_9BURK|nr:MerR family transcriptional regulator [Paraburkholderia domus]MBK5050336.1 MerR family transcriptional regulator [Burkholderia sp. R-70006]MBK5062312.1 MerR family transcriptional regulator [Burkholderia sp. R-70199]MBK5087948.1 MerR family transcriptional regulator [Burkholderia sp. R-69927]MBK5120804.1 MerR family transcriptional regulator [Burkholderia sp. R-69980]MBK5167050.1 MerR family transcriptional regulator [Burkholderia sp. R-70211]MBK5181494.1 MerR family transcriptional regula
MSKMSKALTIGEVAGTIGVSTHTLRYYEQAGLIRAVGRTQAGHRLYSPADLDWLQFVMRLKATGMPIAGMQAFAALRAAGQPTVGERRDMLVAHRDAVLARIAELQSNLGAIVDKIAYYEAAEQFAGQMPATGTPTRQIDETQSLSHSEKDSPWNTHKTIATPEAGTN